MARGGLVNSATGTCIAVINAASGRNDQYEIIDISGIWISFIPDLYCNVGDHWSGSAWLYAGTTPPGVTAAQATAALVEAGFATQLTTAINAAAAANKNIWAPPLITAADVVM